MLRRENNNIMTTSSTARIDVQQRFCDNCSVCIKKKLLNIRGVCNVVLYSKESLIIFNFIEAHTLSIALNVLSNMGYPEKGEWFKTERFDKTFCNC